MLMGLPHGFEVPPAWRLGLAWVGFFTIVGVAGAAVMRRLSRGDRWRLLVAAAVPTMLYALGQGVRPGGVLAIAALVITGMRLAAIPAPE